MSDTFFGEVRMWGLNYAPESWAFCDGQKVEKDENPALYAVLQGAFGETTHTFDLPDLRGQAPMHLPAGYPMGFRAGVEAVRLDVPDIPHHTHAMLGAADAATEWPPANNYLATPGHEMYAPANPTTLTAMNAGAVGMTGGGSPHDNMQPSIVLNFCIAIQGIFPPRN